MPNHCENDLYISGSDADVAALLALIGADQEPPKFDFNALIHYPEKFRQMDAECPQWNVPSAERVELLAAYKAKWGTEGDGFNAGGYDWCVANWGTKWNAYNVQRRDHGRISCVTFETAWAPPMPVIKALAERFPAVTISIEYFERGMAM